MKIDEEGKYPFCLGDTDMKGNHSFFCVCGLGTYVMTVTLMLTIQMPSMGCWELQNPVPGAKHPFANMFTINNETGDIITVATGLVRSKPTEICIEFACNLKSALAHIYLVSRLSGDKTIYGLTRSRTRLSNWAHRITSPQDYSCVHGHEEIDCTLLQNFKLVKWCV